MFEGMLAAGVMSLSTRQPGVIVGPIASLLGIIYNAVFNVIYSIIQSNSLGIAIIVFTILVKSVLVPLVYKQQKATFEMQKLQPEMAKIRKKYASKKDPESQQKMALEMQKLQKDNNISMFGGCLPLLVQLPILYALFYIFQQAYLYIDVVGQNYDAITNVLMSMPTQLRLDLLTDAIMNHKMTVDVASSSDVLLLVNELTRTEWSTLVSAAGDFASQLTPLLEQKASIETFLGISLVNNPGLSFPGILVPICAGLTTYLSTYILTRESAAQQSAAAGDEDPTAAAMQSMKMMNYMMPVVMGVMCINMPGGLGIYWTISNLIQVVQTMVLHKHFKNRAEREAQQ